MCNLLKNIAYANYVIPHFHFLPQCSFLNIFHLVTQYYGDKLFLDLVFPLPFLLLLDEHILNISLLYLFYS